MELARELEASLREFAAAVAVEVRENGGRVAPLAGLCWEVRGAAEKPLLHLWSAEYNLTRHVLAITDDSEQRLILAAYSLGPTGRRILAARSPPPRARRAVALRIFSRHTTASNSSVGLPGGPGAAFSSGYRRIVALPRPGGGDCARRPCGELAARCASSHASVTF